MLINWKNDIKAVLLIAIILIIIITIKKYQRSFDNKLLRKDTEYKPLLFATTMRNPERLKAFLAVLMEYNNKELLTNFVIEKVAKSLIQ